MPALTRDQALAFVDTLLKSPKPKAHLEGALGYGCLPESPGDFDATAIETLERCEDLVGYIAEVSNCLQAYLSNRPRQAELVLNPAGSE